MERETRDIIRIHEELCDGCGLCVPACVEGAIDIIEGKARLRSERFCDGLGACLGDCPKGAISIERREAEPFDGEAVEEYLLSKEEAKTPSCLSSCESLREKRVDSREEGRGEPPSQLSNWPVQLNLISSTAGFLKDPHWLISADCVSYVLANFHRDYLKGKVLLIGCPKLDDISVYYQKLTQLFKEHAPKKVTVMMMEVPCCSALTRLVEELLQEAGYDTCQETIIVGINGKVKKKV